MPATTVPGTTRDNPAPIGTAIDAPNGWRITVLSVTPNANKLIDEHNYFYTPPDRDHQYFVARLSVVRIGDSAKRLDRDFDAVGGSNVAYDTGCKYESVPKPLERKEIFPGGSVTGNICWHVRSGDVPSLVMFYDPVYDRSERRYFSLTP